MKNFAHKQCNMCHDQPPTQPVETIYGTTHKLMKIRDERKTLTMDYAIKLVHFVKDVYNFNYREHLEFKHPDAFAKKNIKK